MLTFKSPGRFLLNVSMGRNHRHAFETTNVPRLDALPGSFDGLANTDPVERKKHTGFTLAVLC